jgi:hypothetical protein
MERELIQVIKFQARVIRVATGEEMPNCPNCGRNDGVELSERPELGTHYCCGGFTPDFARAAKEVKKMELLIGKKGGGR